MTNNAPETSAPRPLHEIARDIRAHWAKPRFTAVPYLDAMAELDGITDAYGHDTAEDIVMRFLFNAGTWRGEHARRIKAELNKILGK